MSLIVGVRFTPSGKIYYFDANDISLQEGDYVIVETNRGKDMGRVVLPPTEHKPEDATEPLKPVIRKATEDDIKQCEKQKNRNDKALSKCKELVNKLNLSMKPFRAHYNIEGNHVVIFFTAEKRVDFRELVKELSHDLKSYVELRQVGARDEAKLIGGIGKCGEQLCCTTFLTEFNPVSIKMAKEQNITLNPMKTSGLCGRLLCCLGYEFDQYKSLKENMPALSQIVTTPLGIAKVVNINPLKQTVWVEIESGALVEYSIHQISWHKASTNSTTQEEATDNK